MQEGSISDYQCMLIFPTPECPGKHTHFANHHCFLNLDPSISVEETRRFKTYLIHV
jgi:hypothetical protein